MTRLGTAHVHDVVVVSNERVAKGLWRMVAGSATLASQILPGQFVDLAVPGDARHILRIPLSFSRADAERGTVELIYAVVGEGTERLSRMREGDATDAVGPCGNGWSVPSGEGRCLLVAGGAGLPPIVAAAGMLASAGRGFDAVVGAQTAARMDVEDAVALKAIGREADDGRRVGLATDDGTLGSHGLVTAPMAELMAERSYDCVLCCGPNPMMAAVAALAHEHGVACQASLERMMGCGFGVCGCCNVELRRGGYARCCTDGPVFDAEEVAW